MGNCIAGRNLKYFVWFLVTSALFSFLSATACLFIAIFTNWDISDHILNFTTVVVVVYGYLMSFILFGMIFDYINLISNDITLNERIKYGYKLRTNAEKMNQMIVNKQIDNTNDKNMTYKQRLWVVLCDEPPKSVMFDHF